MSSPSRSGAGGGGILPRVSVEQCSRKMSGPLKLFFLLASVSLSAVVLLFGGVRTSQKSSDDHAGGPLFKPSLLLTEPRWNTNSGHDEHEVWARSQDWCPSTFRGHNQWIQRLKTSIHPFNSFEQGRFKFLMERKDHPTVIFRPDGQEPYGLEDPLARTHATSRSSIIRAPFEMEGGEGNMMFLPAELDVPVKSAAAVSPLRDAWGAPTACQVFKISTSNTKAPSSYATERPEGGQHAVQPRVHVDSMMFGISSLPSVITKNLDALDYTIPKAIESYDQHSQNVPKYLREPSVVVVRPSDSDLTGAEVAHVNRALRRAKGKGMQLVFWTGGSWVLESGVRYLEVVKRMWQQSLIDRESGGKKVQWFVIMNDDTMFVDTKSILHMLAKYDPSEPVIVGSFSDLRADHSDVPHLDAGGGMFISAAAMEKMNSGSKLDECVRLFGNVVNAAGIIARCASFATSVAIPTLLSTEPSLHQVNRSSHQDMTSFLQSGSRITSLGHTRLPQVSLLPAWHASADDEVSLLLGRTARAVGGDNWGKRYTFDGGKVEVVLGYSVRVYREGEKLDEDAVHEKAQIQDEEWPEEESTYGNTSSRQDGSYERPPQRTYFVHSIHQPEKDVYVLGHKSEDGSILDIVVDVR